MAFVFLYMNIIGFIIAFVVSVATIPLVSKLCFKSGLLDVPNERKVHKKPIPRLGGISIWVSSITAFSLLAMLNFSGFDKSVTGVLVGGSFMFLLGIFDDIYNLNPKTKLVLQIVAAIIAFVMGVKIEFIHNPFGDMFFLGAFSLPVTVIWLVGITNAMNFIDGVDGLAGGVSTLCAITLGVIALYTAQPAVALVAMILAGSMLGFLSFNYNPARIFMGDSGALFAGFVLAGLSVTGVLKTIAVSVILPILVFSVPILDILFSVFRRLSKGANPMVADGEHIHHKLLKAGLSQNRTVAVLYLLCITTGAIATFLIGAHRLYIVLTTIALLLMLLFVQFGKFRKFRELQAANQENKPFTV